MSEVPTLDELLTGAQHRVLHLELRDNYAVSDGYAARMRNEPSDPETFAAWHRKVRPLIEQGVSFRRARIVSEPVSTYIRWEYGITHDASIVAGEHVRWLPRRLASEIPLPGNDFWLVDDVLLYSHFSGDGEKVGVERGHDLTLAVDAFERVWALGTDHGDYKPG